MKNSIFTIAFCCFFSMNALFSQTEQGKVFIGTSYNFTPFGQGGKLLNVGQSTMKVKSDNPMFEEEEDNDKISIIQISPQVGYAFIDNFFAGVSLDYLRIAEKYQFLNEERKFSVSLFSVGPFIRYYIPAGTVMPYIEAGAQFGSTTIKDDEDDTDKGSIFSYRGEAGVAIPIGRKVSFDIGLNYSNATQKEKEDNPDNVRLINTQFGVNVGVTVYLGGGSSSAE